MVLFEIGAHFFFPCCRTIFAGDRSIYTIFILSVWILSAISFTFDSLYLFFFFKETIQEKRYRVFFFSSRHLWLSNFMPCRAGNCKCRDSFPAEERNRGRERERAKEKVWLRGKLFWCWVFVFCASVNIRWLGVTITNVEVLKKIDSLTFSREK